MESENEVPLEQETTVHPVNETVEGVNTNVADPNPLNKVEEEVDSPRTEVNQPSENVTTPKARNRVKVTTKGSSFNNSNLVKNGPNRSTFGRTQRPSLSQSLTFPSKPTKQVVGPTLSTSASSRSNLVSRRTFSGLKPVKTTFKEDDGTSSTASPNTATPGGRRRSSTAGFSFRLDERAERRKQFYSKIEERVQAKEVEKTNLEAKSKESQEKEIKKFRKSLTFKATPMPSFYKEPPPTPKLKKIPTTRPRSPKLGRSKSSLSKSSEPNEIGHSPRAIRDQTMSPRVNQPTRKSLTKTSEVKAKKSKDQGSKPQVREEKATQAPDGGPHEVEGRVEVDTSSANQDMTPKQIVVGG